MKRIGAFSQIFARWALTGSLGVAFAAAPTLFDPPALAQTKAAPALSDASTGRPAFALNTYNIPLPSWPSVADMP